MFRTFFTRLTALVVLSALSSTALFAAPSPSRSLLEINPACSHISYSEPGLMEERGELYGIEARYSWHSEHPGAVDLLRGEVSASLGSFDYTSTSAGSIKGVHDSMLEARVLAGSDLYRQGERLVTVLFGIGYRRLNDHSLGMVSTTGALGYDRQANYYYSPLGIEITTPLENGWSMGGLAEYDLFWRGRQVTGISPALLSGGSSSSNEFINEQKRGYGLKASVRFQKQLGASSSLGIEPFFRYWSIGRSATDSVVVTDAAGAGTTVTVVEPANSSSEYGIKVLFSF
ncbi:MAG: hypothetical protein WCH05_09450 [Chlorobiaceae bacterium]